MKRRSVVLGLGAIAMAAASPCVFARAQQPLRILVLGGRSFLGPAIVTRLRTRGHTVTLFNRGLTNPQLFSELELIRGDRDAPGGLAALEGVRRWDAVIDVWPFEPRMIEATARLLRGRAAYYYYVSSVAAYQNPGAAITVDESLPLRAAAPGYNGGKAESERILQRLWPNNSGVARPVGIAGERDDGMAVCYWLTKVLEPGQFIAPGDGKDLIQQVDVHDVAALVVDSVESQRSGPLNASGHTYEWATWLAIARDAVEGRGQPVWVDAQFLLSNGVRQHDNMPIWRWRNDPTPRPIYLADRAMRLGWTLTPMVQTLRRAWVFSQTLPASERVFPAVQGSDAWGLSDQRERELLTLWSQTQHRAV
jgi:2'-hydroxyisoflavone reductase